MSEQKIKIRRSSGKVQYVTREELDELNERRKRRDQERDWSKFNNPVQGIFSALLFLCGIAIFVLLIRF